MRQEYEYAVEGVRDRGNGGADKEQIAYLLTQYSRNGWRLHTVFTNEVGKNSVSVGGFGINSTMDETILIFERELAKVRRYEQEEKERIDADRMRKETERIEKERAIQERNEVLGKLAESEDTSLSSLLSAISDCKNIREIREIWMANKEKYADCEWTPIFDDELKKAWNTERMYGSTFSDVGQFIGIFQRKKDV